MNRYFNPISKVTTHITSSLYKSVPFNTCYPDMVESGRSVWEYKRIRELDTRNMLAICDTCLGGCQYLEGSLLNSRQRLRQQLPFLRHLAHAALKMLEAG